MKGFGGDAFHFFYMSHVCYDGYKKISLIALCILIGLSFLYLTLALVFWKNEKNSIEKFEKLQKQFKSSSGGAKDFNENITKLQRIFK